MSYSDTLATIALFVSVLGTIFSCLLSYNLSIRAEKRKEFNLIADKINLFLREEIEMVASGQYHHQMMTREDCYQLMQRCGKREGRKILVAFDLYEKAHSSCYETVGGFNRLKDEEKLTSAILKLIHLVRYK